MNYKLPPLPEIAHHQWFNQPAYSEADMQAYAIAAIEAQGVPDGWQLVPKEPTIAMLLAGSKARVSLEQTSINGAAYTAMLASAPPAPQADAIDYKPGEWFDTTSVDLMQRFFESRLPVIREAAREHGYAIGVHGSMRRDMDLIAAPWNDGASDADTLAHAVAMAACGITRDGQYQWTAKPLGRVATSIPICWTHRHGVANDGHIDLSVMPKTSARIQPPCEAFEAWIKSDSTLPLDRDEHGYADMTTALMWHAWQAAIKQAGVVQHEPRHVAYLDIGAGGYVDLGSDLTTDELQGLPKGRHMLVIAGTFGIDGYVPANPAQQPKPQPLSDYEFDEIG